MMMSVLVSFSSCWCGRRGELVELSNFGTCRDILDRLVHPQNDKPTEHFLVGLYYRNFELFSNFFIIF
jgi:hypothetical protein